MMCGRRPASRRWRTVRLFKLSGRAFMIRRLILILGVVALALAQDRPVYKVKVDMVVLSFQIFDNKGHYVNNLKPKDFRVLEDGIPQRLNSFAEGSRPPAHVQEDGSLKPIIVAEEGQT